MNASTLNHRFSAERSLYLLRNRLLDELPVIGIGLGVAAALNAIGLVFARTAPFNHNSTAVWAIVVLWGGLMLASMAFKGMQDGKTGTDWLLLPATPLEKFSVAALNYLVLIPVAGSLVVSALSALLYVIERAIGGSGGAIWTPFQPGVLEAWLAYGVAASVFLAGSASFRKAAFLKTFAVFAAYCLAMAILFMLAVWLVSKGHGFDASNLSFRNGEFNFNGSNVSETTQAIVRWGYRIACDVLLPLFALVFGYFKVQEKEARDEVQ